MNQNGNKLFKRWAEYKDAKSYIDNALDWVDLMNGGYISIFAPNEQETIQPMFLITLEYLDGSVPEYVTDVYVENFDQAFDACTLHIIHSSESRDNEYTLSQFANFDFEGLDDIKAKLLDDEDNEFKMKITPLRSKED